MSSSVPGAGTPVLFVHGLWLHAMSWDPSVELFRAEGYAPARPLWQGAFANVNPRSPLKVDTANAERGPLLLTAGGRDHVIPPVITRSTHKRYRRSPAVTDIHEFPDRGHSLGADSGWRDVADHVLGWLRSHGL